MTLIKIYYLIIQLDFPKLYTLVVGFDNGIVIPRNRCVLRYLIYGIYLGCNSSFPYR